MKKLLLLSALFIFACSSSGDGSDNSLDFDCPDFDGSTSQSDARNMAIDYDSEDYYSLVSEYGEPISEGYFVDGEDYYTPLCSKIIKAKHMEIKFATL